MKRKWTLASLCAVILCCTIPFPSARACTIWAATGDKVTDKGSIIAKNRDNLSHLYTTMRFVSPENGIAFFGIFDVEADGYVTAGVNAKGFVVVNASANSVPRKKRHTATEDLTERLLTSFGSVGEVLADKNLFRKSHPAIYIIGDSSTIASVEVAPGGRTCVTTEINGTLAFTNHYTCKRLLKANERLSRSSFLRLQRINHLLSANAASFTAADFIAFSNDKDGGSDGALWKAQDVSGRIRTLAGWVVRLPPKGAPEVHVKLANTDEPERTETFTLDDTFWGRKKNAGYPNR